jgi:3-hydroxymyristoyl/3-hydroxydecanoyl-(acyl carrier protein) dehydratase
VGGKRISRQEIEQIARQIPRVKDVACTSRRVNGLRGEEVLLAVESDDLDASTVKNRLRASLDPVFVPRRVRVVRELSRSDRGKVDREALLALFKGGAQPDGEHFNLASLETDSVRFRGHFAGAPIFPALAQLTDLVLPEVRRRFGGGDLLELNRVKWTEPLRPGARVKVVLARKTRGIRFEVRVADASGERTACSGTLVLAAHTPTSPGAEA